jgi:hypothetical protein
MNTLISTSIDYKNIGLVKLLHRLRQDLDIFCLVSVNVDGIKQRGIGVSFFGHLRQLVIESIALSICKIYEHEGKHELNSIHGVFRNLPKDVRTILDNAKLKAFIQKYNGPLIMDDPISAIESTIKKYRKRYQIELDRFKNFRNKKAAHSQYEVSIDNLPSFDVMENLFYFGADFYALISSSFIGVGPHDLNSQRYVKTSLKKVFQKLGIEDIRTDMQ